MARSVFDQFQMTVYVLAVSCPYSNQKLSLIAPSLHAAVEGFPLVARACKGGLTLAVGHVVVTIFVDLTLRGGIVAHCSGLLGLLHSASCQ